jgi:deoxyribonuclease V
VPLVPAVSHRWDLTPREAVALQRELAGRTRLAPLGPVRTVAGVDVSVRAGHVRAAIVVMTLSPLAVIETATWEGPAAFPYVPGLLSFREMPAVIPAMARLATDPDVFMLDAQGLAHPRRFGLACHLGVVFDRPAFGVAKTRLVGEHRQPGPERGERAPLVHDGETVGCVLRTRTSVKPVFVSVGHRATLEEAVALTLTTAPRYKLPEPARLAHRLSKYGRL